MKSRKTDALRGAGSSARAAVANQRARSASVVKHGPASSASVGLWAAAVLVFIVSALATAMWLRRSHNTASTIVVPQAPAQTTIAPAASVPAPGVDANRAMSYVRDVVAFGPRPVGSEAHNKTEVYILSHLKSIAVDDDKFIAATPAGNIPMRNIIAKFPGEKPGVVVIATHYDTLYGRKDFVGANDGGSGTGLLLELANQLRGAERKGDSIWLVWLDGEEAVRHWTPTDSTYGSRHLTEKWQKDGTTKQIKAFLLADMIGDADLNIERDANSTPWLEDLVFQAAAALGFQSHFFGRQTEINDDHLSFARVGVPVADLIDFEYGYGNSFWHTSQDTLDKLSPRSLQIVGDVLLESAAMLDRKQ